MARQEMLENGFEPEFPPQVQQQLGELKAHPPHVAPGANIRDLRNLLWSSIDNDTSRDLDQIEVAERLPNGEMKILVGIADVDTFVPKSSAIDLHAGKETITVYTGVKNFPMLPEQLSTDTSSLLEAGDKPSIVIEFVVGIDGVVHSGSVYQAIVQNKAQLTYNTVGTEQNDAHTGHQAMGQRARASHRFELFALFRLQLQSGQGSSQTHRYLHSPQKMPKGEDYRARLILVA